MNEEKLNEFAKKIVNNIRDQAIEECDANLSFTNLDNPITKRWYDAMQKGDFKEFAKNIIADAVDSALFHVLHSVDYEDFDIAYKIDDVKYELGKEYSGELAGYYMGSWVQEFSQQRYYNDLPNYDNIFDDEDPE